MRSTFKLLFYVNRQKMNEDGLCPIMGRITIDGKVCQYATQMRVSLPCWDVKSGRAYAPPRREAEARAAEAINRRLDYFVRHAEMAYRNNLIINGFVTAEMIRNAITGRAQPKGTFLALFDEHNREYAKRVGIDRARCTYVRYLNTRRHLANFIRSGYGQDDIEMRRLDMKFIQDFQFYLSSVCRLRTVTLNNHLVNMQKIVQLAIKERVIKYDPFAGFKRELVPVRHRYLTHEQLTKLMEADLPTYRLSHTRDLFVFSVFTGLGRAELAALTDDNIVTERDGSQWIYIRRQKTKVECRIKLMDIPLQILNKYRGEGPASDADNRFYRNGIIWKSKAFNGSEMTMGIGVAGRGFNNRDMIPANDPAVKGFNRRRMISANDSTLSATNLASSTYNEQTDSSMYNRKPAAGSKLYYEPLGSQSRCTVQGKETGPFTSGKLFFVPVSSSLERSLHLIEKQCHLDCHLTFYMARHTFATEICLSNGMPIETISQMMGHSNIRTTQIYAEITNQKVKDDFDKLSLKTNAKYHLPTPPMPPTNLHIKSQSSPKKQACTKEATYLNGKVSPNKQACTAEATYLNGKVSPKKQACTKEATYLNGQSSPNKQAYTEDILAIDHLPTDKPLPLRYYRRGRRVTKSFR